MTVTFAIQKNKTRILLNFSLKNLKMRERIGYYSWVTEHNLQNLALSIVTFQKTGHTFFGKSSYTAPVYTVGAENFSDFPTLIFGPNLSLPNEKYAPIFPSKLMQNSQLDI